jgi:hypothetical protein
MEGKQEKEGNKEYLVNCKVGKKKITIINYEK